MHERELVLVHESERPEKVCVCVCECECEVSGVIYTSATLV